MHTEVDFVFFLAWSSLKKNFFTKKRVIFKTKEDRKRGKRDERVKMSENVEIVSPIKAEFKYHRFLDYFNVVLYCKFLKFYESLDPGFL